MQIFMIEKILILLFLFLIPMYGLGSWHIQAYGLSNKPFVGKTNEADICYVDQYAKQLQPINGAIRHQKQISSEELRWKYRYEFVLIMHSYTCANRAVLLGIKKLPAIVFNGKAVIYGETNIKKAMLIYQHVKDRKND